MGFSVNVLMPLMYYGYLTLSTENFLQKLKILEIVTCKQISTPYIKLWLKPNKGFFLRKSLYLAGKILK
jgi:hypothetical protein